MKKMMFVVLCALMSMSSSYASEVKLTTEKTTTIRKLDDFKVSVTIIEKGYTLCDVTVTVSIGVGSTHASATVTAKDVNCDDLIAVIRRLKAQARDALT
jgi:hypothetical protein